MDEKQGRVVVGVDGSSGSRAALAYAVRDAARRGAGVEVITTYEFPAYWTPPYGTLTISLDDVGERTRKGAEGFVHEVIGQFESEIEQLPPVTVRTIAGGAAHAILKASDGADLLVVGSRGHGGFSSMLLGSVSLKCALHATALAVPRR
jgi:nucleotide-binding universal stress UspA family protein